VVASFGRPQPEPPEPPAPRSTGAQVVLVPVWDDDALKRFGDALRAQVVRAIHEGYAEAVGAPLTGPATTPADGVDGG
jgi:hypothetical protein